MCNIHCVIPTVHNNNNKNNNNQYLMCNIHCIITTVYNNNIIGMCNFLFTSACTTADTGGITCSVSVVFLLFVSCLLL